MGDGAAFFDLDRTLLAGASGPVLADAMRTAGLAGRSVPGEQLLYSFFNTFGETLPGMVLARQAVRVARGRSQAAVQEAARAAAETLVAMIQPFASGLFEEHRRAGRPLVLATTTPYDLVRPLADALGFDDVVATRYGVRADGTYDGTITGSFVWANGKLGAVRDWAAGRELDLADSWFYSDSVYDSPLLSSVGHPVAVNPDPRLAILAIARRWPVVYLDVPPGVPKMPVLGLEPQQFVLFVARPELMRFVRFDIDGVENIPASGPAILCANHRSYFDVVAMAVTLGRAGRTVRFLGKKELFDAPVLGSVARAFGGIRVDRGAGSERPLAQATTALEAGQAVAIMPQGTIPRGAAFFEPVLVGRSGAARLAAGTKAPVIPIGLWGTEKVWPRSAKVPRVVNVLHPPTVRVRVGVPVELAYGNPSEDTARIMAAIMELLPPEASERHVPTDAELAATVPGGHQPVPDSDHEPARPPPAAD